MSINPIARRRPRAHDGSGSAELAVFAATELLLRDTPLEALTVAQIIKQAGLSRANFYHYFASKYDVVAALLGRLLDDIYAKVGPWNADPGKSRERSLGASLQRTREMWSEHDAVICAVLEHMHVVPQLAAAWNLMSERFVAATAEQIEFERSADRASHGADAQLIATVLVCGNERSFYIGSRHLDSRLPTPEAAVDSITELTQSAIYGDRRTGKHGKTKRVAGAPTVPPPSSVEAATESVGAEGGDPETAETILRATAELLDEMTLDEVSVATILERAGTSRATFYFYFGNKDDAFNALFQRAAQRLVDSFAELATVDRTDPARIRAVLTAWLTLPASDFGVLRSAIHEWPRRPDLRARYLATVAGMTDVLEAVIEADRAAGLAVAGPPAPELATVLMWTIERSIAGSLAGEANLGDTEPVIAFLCDLLLAVVYRR